MDALNQAESNVSIILSPWKITRILLVVVAILVSLSLIGHLVLYFLPNFPMKSAIVGKFALNKEYNIPTLYSAFSLVISSGLLAFIANLKQKVKARYTNYWYALSFIFMVLAFDEMFGFHELLSIPLQKAGIDGFLHNAWLVPAAIFLLVFFISFARFFFHLPRTTRRHFLLATVLFIGGACVIELFDGYYAFLHGKDNIGYALFSTVEETLEMLGIVAFIHALSTYITRLDIKKLGAEVYLYPNPSQPILVQR